MSPNKWTEDVYPGFQNLYPFRELFSDQAPER
jgi:hypothetical protein